MDEFLLRTARDGPLTPGEQVTVAELRAQHVTVPDMARLLRRTPDAIYKTIAEARTVLEGSALDAAQHWVEASARAAAKGNHRPARELLEAVGAIERTAQPSAGPQVVVQMGFALPGVPAQPTPIPLPNKVESD